MSAQATGPARVPAPDRVRPLLLHYGLLCAAIATGCLVLALLLGGAAPQPAPLGLPDPGPLTGWGLPVARLVGATAAVLTTGLLLLAGVLLTSADDRLDGTGRSAVRAASVAAAVALVAAVVQAVLTLSDFRGVSPYAALDPSELAWFAAHTVQGWTLGAQAVLALAIAVLARAQRTTEGAWRLLLAALFLVAVPTLAGHSATSQRHVLAGLSLVVHVLAASLWVGGLAGLALVARRSMAPLVAAVPRYSRLALGCATAVAASGMVIGALHVGSLAALTSTGYGRVVLAKLAALAMLIGFGWLHRRHTVPQLAALESADHGTWPRSVFLRLAAVELLVMSATYGLAVGLSRSPVPVL